MDNICISLFDTQSATHNNTQDTDNTIIIIKIIVDNNNNKFKNLEIRA